MESHHANQNFNEISNAFIDFTACFLTKNLDYKQALKNLKTFVKFENWQKVISDETRLNLLGYCVGALLLEANAKMDSNCVAEIFQEIKKGKLPLDLFTDNSETYPDTSIAKPKEIYEENALLCAVKNDSYELVMLLIANGILSQQNIYRIPVIQALHQHNTKIAGTILQAHSLSVVRNASYQETKPQNLEEEVQVLHDQNDEQKNTRVTFANENVEKKSEKEFVQTNPFGVQKNSLLQSPKNSTVGKSISTKPDNSLDTVSLTTVVEKNNDTESNRLTKLMKKIKRKVEKRKKVKVDNQSTDENATQTPRYKVHRRHSSLRGFLSQTDFDLTQEILKMLNADEKLKHAALKDAFNYRLSTLLQIILEEDGADVQRLFSEELNFGSIMLEENAIIEKLKMQRDRIISVQQSDVSMLEEEQTSGNEINTRHFNNTSTLLAVANNGYPIQSKKEAFEVAELIFGAEKHYFANEKHKATLALAYLLIAEEGYKKSLPKEPTNTTKTKSEKEEVIGEQVEKKPVSVLAMVNHMAQKSTARAQGESDETNLKTLHYIQGLKNKCIRMLMSGDAELKIEPTTPDREQFASPQLFIDNSTNQTSSQEQQSNSKDTKEEVTTTAKYPVRNVIEYRFTPDTFQELMLSSGLLYFLYDIRRFDSQFLSSLDWNAIYHEVGCTDYAKQVLSKFAEDQLSDPNLDIFNLIQILAIILLDKTSRSEERNKSIKILTNLSRNSISACMELSTYYHSIDNLPMACEFAFERTFDKNLTDADRVLIYPIQKKFFLDDRIRTTLSQQNFFNFLTHQNFKFIKNYFKSNVTLVEKTLFLLNLLTEIQDRLRYPFIKNEQTLQELSNLLFQVQEDLVVKSFQENDETTRSLGLLLDKSSSPSAGFYLGCLALKNYKNQLVEEQKKNVPNQFHEDLYTDAFLINFGKSKGFNHVLSATMLKHKDMLMKNKMPSTFQSDWEACAAETQTIKHCIYAFLSKRQIKDSAKLFKSTSKGISIFKDVFADNQIHFAKAEDMLIKLDQLVQANSKQLNDADLKLICFIVHKILENYDYFPKHDLAKARRASFEKTR